MTSTASAVSACVFAHRAIWFRLLPMRATCTVRSRSTATARAVHVRGPRHGLPQQVGRRHAGRRLRLPGGVLRWQHAGADNGRAAVSHQSTARGNGGKAPIRGPGRAAECRGVRRGRAAPLASPM